MKHSWYIKKFFSPLGKLSLIAILWLGGVFAFDAINKTHFIHPIVTTEVSADGNINIWWPTEGSHVSDTQAFKAQVQDKNVSDYDMYWSVDGGQKNQMSDSSTDYPHKEAQVDLKSWNWHGSGPYKVTFSAVDKSNNPLGESSINIYTPEAAQGPTTVVAATSTDPVAAIATSTVSVLPTVSALVAQVAGIQTTTASTTNDVKVDLTQKTLSIASPTSGASISGQTNFSAKLEGGDTSTYKMYWAVDGGRLNALNATDDHFQASVDVSGWNWRGSGPYKISFIVTDLHNTQVKASDVTITINRSQVQASLSQPSLQSVVITPVASTPTPGVDTLKNVSPILISNSSVFSGEKLYVDPNSDAKHTADQWRTTRPQDAFQMDKIAKASEAVWLGDWNSDIRGFTSQKVSESKKQGALPVFVAYNIPARDCGQYSSGGAHNPDGYRSWIRGIADGIGSSKAAVILEPDAITLTDCLSPSQLSDRYQLIKDAVGILKSKGNIAVYIDAGHPDWISPSEMGTRLTKAGIAQADGFSLNISNFYTTQDNSTYGKQISDATGGKHFVVDTSRNGMGPTSDKQWCNPSGRALGASPTTNTGYPLIDAFLWIKGPGGSDGNCNGGPGAGVWWADYALDMAKRSAN